MDVRATRYEAALAEAPVIYWPPKKPPARSKLIARLKQALTECGFLLPTVYSGNVGSSTVLVLSVQRKQAVNAIGWPEEGFYGRGSRPSRASYVRKIATYRI